MNYKGLDKWIKNEQAKHRLCACGCGKEIVIQKSHHSKSIQKYINGHQKKGKHNALYSTNLIKTQTVDNWVNSERGKHFCHCGCGGEIPIRRWHCSKGVSKYIKGHHSKGKILSLATKKKLSKSATGKKHSNEQNKKMSQIMSGRFKGKLNPMYGRTGPSNPAWNGGTSFEPYCHKFNNELKERIRERDNRTCQNCGIKENGRKLSVHHIHYDKDNCYPDLITLCNSCNLKANGNRDYWEEYYMAILETRGLLNWS